MAIPNSKFSLVAVLVSSFFNWGSSVLYTVFVFSIAKHNELCIHGCFSARKTGLQKEFCMETHHNYCG